MLANSGTKCMPSSELLRPRAKGAHYSAKAEILKSLLLGMLRFCVKMVHNRGKSLLQSLGLCIPSTTRFFGTNQTPQLMPSHTPTYTQSRPASTQPQMATQNLLHTIFCTLSPRPTKTTNLYKIYNLTNFQPINKLIPERM